MVFVFVLISVVFIVFVGFYILSFSFFGGLFSNFYNEVFQSQFIVSQNFKLVDDYKKYFLTNGSGYNDLTGDLIDDNYNDDNLFCFDNIGTGYKDDDCLYRSLYGFLPPNKQIDLGYFESISGSGLEFYFTGNLNKTIDVNLNFLNEKTDKAYRFESTGFVDVKFENDSFNLKLKNENNSRIQYFIKLENGEGIKKVDKNLGTNSLSQKYNYFLNSKKVMSDDLLIKTGYNTKPVNPFSGNFTIGDYDSLNNNCAKTGKNDLSFSWVWTGNINLTGNTYFKISTGNTKNITGGYVTGSLGDYCDSQFICNWTGKDYDNNTYYIKADTYRCTNSGCTSKIKNLNGSYIYSGVVDTCSS